MTVSPPPPDYESPADLALFCLARIQKIAQAGPRHLLPLPEEITAIEVLSIDTTSSMEDLTLDIVTGLGLLDTKYYGIFQVDHEGVEKYLSKNEFVAEIMSSWSLAITIPDQYIDNTFIARGAKVFICMGPNVKKGGFRFGHSLLKKFSKNANGSPQAYEYELLEKYEQIKKGVDKTPKPTFLLKRNLFIEDPMAPISSPIKASVLAFDYAQAVHDVVTARNFALKEVDALMLGALQLRSFHYLNLFLVKMGRNLDTSKFGPSEFVRGREKRWGIGLLKTLKALPVENDMTIRQCEYLELLKTCCPLFQSSFFFVRQKIDRRLPSELYVAINLQGIYFVHTTTKEPIVHIRYLEINSWGHSPISFSIVAGNMSLCQEHWLITRQGEEIAETLQLFVNSLTGGFSNSPKLVGSPVKSTPQIPHPPKPSQPLTIFEYNETQVNKLKPSNSLGK
ncbi:unnamed protein product [Sphagnum jensenii]|uniref:IRS-type PTB domain-containing protein n=2 Tax=Sphagnum jensenii TaxID=128206 RepID=A0ABP0ZXN6_9BRYO